MKLAALELELSIKTGLYNNARNTLERMKYNLQIASLKHKIYLESIK